MGNQRLDAFRMCGIVLKIQIEVLAVPRKDTLRTAFAEKWRIHSSANYAQKLFSDFRAIHQSGLIIS